MMKQFLLVVLAIACAAVLIMGNLYWQERTALTKTEQKEDTQVSPKEKPTKEKKKVKDEETEFTAKWPKNAKAVYKKKVKNGDPFKIVILGSPALGASEGGWAPQLKESLLTAYDDTIEVTIHEWDTTSVEFVNGTNVDTVLEETPDLVLWEPFTLVDNSNGVGPLQNHDSILIFDRELHETNETATLILQPPHPIENATYYPANVDELKAFAEEESIPYLDHWSDWPEDGTLSDYLIEDQDTPNAKGYTLWNDYLVDYFIAD
ncbi:SGNH/GDSL hydrolase family protein [Rossellomorea marisflavi]|uniref:SGNH/GDSL hydrolase family protein n=1 Tax=Rossellomorea marisflavi TaxID=189381 RepID=UPI001EE39A22|nr:SGNH/GDSL hydrolase family protein [Rossellomorea marisflavi]UKS64978.1 hypothetical protein K6T23_19965 [Rossellomorea marisflavi]